VLAKSRGIIVDERPQGVQEDNWDLVDLIPYLAKEPFVSARWEIPEIQFPDREGMRFREERWPPAPPKEPHLGARVLIINVPSVVSYGESIEGILEAYKLAEFVGEPTAGTNGNVNFNTLPGGYRVMWTGMKVIKHDGSQHHLVGIQPTYPVKRTLKAVAEGRDEYLENAVEILKGTAR
jgi:C-terminal processing protease CtpA/Prc